MTKTKAATSPIVGAFLGAVGRACISAAGRAGRRLFDALDESRQREAARVIARHQHLFDQANQRLGERARETPAARKAPPRHAKALRLSFLIPLAALAALAVLASKAARAADLPTRMYTKAPVAQPVAAYDWSGLYLGGHVGYEWGRTRVETDGVLTEPHAKTNGTDGGALVGYNCQMGVLVAGLEGDFGWSNAHGVGAIVVTPDPIVTREPNTYDVNWTSHARGRLGYAADRWLVYGAGGLAVAGLDFREGAVTTTIVGAKYYGWSAGGGVEGAVTDNLLARVEYLYDDYGHKDYTGVAGDTDHVSLTGQTLRGALVWKFTPAAKVQ